MLHVVLQAEEAEAEAMRMIRVYEDAATQLAAMRTRGAVEEFAPNPQLLEEGKVRLGGRMQGCSGGG